MHRSATLLGALALASCCLTPVSEGDDAGSCVACAPRDAGSCAGCPPPDAGTASTPCTSDADCDGGYCDMAIDGCPGAGELATAMPGFCHRDCQDSACACQDAADCPLSAATGNPSACGADGQCAAFGAFCGGVTCPAACPLAQPRESLCPVCLCAVCPAPDAGSGGGCDGTATLSGGCGSAAPFTVATATVSSSASGGATIVLSSVGSCQATLPSNVSFEALLIDISAGALAPGTYGLDGGGTAILVSASYVSWLGGGQGNGGGGSQPATGGFLTLSIVNLDAGTITGFAALDFGSACGSAGLQGTFTTEPSSCCQ